ncbi:MAG: hypothetical protein RM368_26755 [Nostoc sp. DedSLP03]|uniref:hypothetical protein n=1 Tax=Nostoc sp. DedSLP03 TaxID=3075400 RepID=UPI002AD47286|nr:hypothetical protein [Nostoc sp. DedSLP03]MDZ7968510.1 hypothetical protein [Nostoc sp. DedSLP03]
MSARPTIMLSGVFVNIVQSMTFAIAYGGRVRHRALIWHNKESDGRILRENWCKLLG